MRTITKLFIAASIFAVAGNVATAQTNLDFETAGTGSTYSWSSWANPPAVLTTETNPVAGGINNTAKVLKFAYDAAGGQWDGAFTDDMGDFTISASNCKVKVMVYKSVSSEMIFKLEKGTVAFESKLTNTKINQWEELTFDFTSLIGQTVNRVVLWTDTRATRSSNELVSYLDNIVFTSATALPSVSANEIGVYPNPTNGVLNITATQELSKVIVSNIVGVTVKTIAVSGLSSKIDLSDVAKGAYIITIVQENGAASTQKVVIN